MKQSKEPGVVDNTNRTVYRATYSRAVYNKISSPACDRVSCQLSAGCKHSYCRIIFRSDCCDRIPDFRNASWNQRFWPLVPAIAVGNAVIVLVFSLLSGEQEAWRHEKYFLWLAAIALRCSG